MKKMLWWTGIGLIIAGAILSAAHDEIGLTHPLAFEIFGLDIGLISSAFGLATATFVAWRLNYWY
ncbi:MAG: hypothetical protein Q8Q95_04040 [bacterium]|nr:hypothetical protein [bacterium]